jgi:septal ring factor EnvC (AmiA/AmiB activator)
MKIGETVKPEFVSMDIIDDEIENVNKEIKELPKQLATISGRINRKSRKIIKESNIIKDLLWEYQISPDIKLLIEVNERRKILANKLETLNNIRKSV